MKFFKNKTISYDLTAKVTEPKWYELRRKLARFLVNIARWVYAESPEVYLFHVKLAMDAMIYGQPITRVDPSDMFGREGE